MPDPIATVGHFELPATDLERAAAFYREVFGWAVEPLAWEGPPYFTVRPSAPAAGGTPGSIRGGLGAAATVGAEHPLLVIHLAGEGLDSALARIERAGGTIVEPPRKVGEMGDYARFRDCEGSLLGLWSPAVKPGRDPRP